MLERRAEAQVIHRKHDMVSKTLVTVLALCFVLVCSDVHLPIFTFVCRFVPFLRLPELKLVVLDVTGACLVVTCFLRFWCLLKAAATKIHFASL